MWLYQHCSTFTVTGCQVSAQSIYNGAVCNSKVLIPLCLGWVSLYRVEILDIALQINGIVEPDFLQILDWRGVYQWKTNKLKMSEEFLLKEL